MSVAPFDRQLSLERLGSERFELLVVGGGITGCGVALDAASRGIKTALVEARDFASGTSSKSSKLVHGGLRYLQQREYLLVYEALHERQRLLRNAPHLVHPLPFLIPLFGKDGVVSKGVAQAFSIALTLYDVTGGLRIGKRHQRVSARQALDHFPVLRTDRLVASFLYWDAQADDARLTMAIARTAAAKGAVLANYSPVVRLLDEGGRVHGAQLADGTQVQADVVVNAGGVWSEELARLSASSSPISIRPAKGIHVTVPAEKLPCDYASVLAVPGDKRSVFVVPWAADEAQGPTGPGRFTYIGTTDTDYEGPLDYPHCTSDDIDYVLRAVNAWTSANLTADDVTGSWAGLRPLISDARSERTADLSRRHKVSTDANGLVSVTGGKLTTYRLMAADTVNAAVKQLGRRVPRSTTDRLRLIGAERPAAETGGPPAFAHLKGRYGSEAEQVIGLCDEDPSLATPINERLPYLGAEVVFAVRHEMAQTVSDVLARRTRSLILDRAAAVDAAPLVAALMARELGWDAAEQQRQVASFVTEAEAEADAQLHATSDDQVHAPGDEATSAPLQAAE